MALYQWDKIPQEKLNPQLARQVIHTANMTMARLYLMQGAVVPRHSHHHEQITTVEQGRLKFIFDDEEQVVEVGQSLEIPPHRPHRVEALEDSVALDLFAPVREDWRDGSDAYLRNAANSR